MKLLFDHNLSPSLVRRLGEVFPGSDHVFSLRLHEEPDTAIWEFARRAGFIVVSKDADLAEVTMQKGFPQKLVWLRIGNCTKNDIEQLLRNQQAAVSALADDPERGILSLFKKRVE